MVHLTMVSELGSDTWAWQCADRQVPYHSTSHEAIIAWWHCALSVSLEAVVKFRESIHCLAVVNW